MVVQQNKKSENENENGKRCDEKKSLHFLFFVAYFFFSSSSLKKTASKSFLYFKNEHSVLWFPIKQGDHFFFFRVKYKFNFAVLKVKHYISEIIFGRSGISYWCLY